MKGQKEKTKEKEKQLTKNYIDRTHTANTIGLTHLDMVPLVFNKENVMKWLAESGWIEGCIIVFLGDQFPYLDDYIQEIYLLIFDKLDKLIEVYEDRGILAFCGYIKMIIRTNCFAEAALVYKKIRRFSRDFTVSCDDKTWNDILDKYDPDTMPFYKFNKTNELI